MYKDFISKDHNLFIRSIIQLINWDIYIEMGLGKYRKKCIMKALYAFIIDELNYCFVNSELKATLN